MLLLFLYALLCIHSSFAIILKRKKKLVVLLLLSLQMSCTVYVLWLFFLVPCVGLHCVIVVFSDSTHLLFVYKYFVYKYIYENRTEVLY